MASVRREQQFDIRTIGVEAYVYLYPLVLMDVTRLLSTSGLDEGRVGTGPTNAFAHVRAFPDAEFRAVVRPNFDTLYSSAWLDLTDGPVVVSAPDTGGRYYTLPILDMWTDVFFAGGWRTSGTGPAEWTVVPPGWTGELPDGARVVHAPTPYVWIIGRTQTNGPADYPAVNALQDRFAVRASRSAEADVDPSLDLHAEPLRQVASMSAVDFFTRAAQLLAVHPPHLSDASQLERLRWIGIEPGKPFDPSVLDPAELAALEDVPAAGLAAMQHTAETGARVANGWAMNTDTMGVYGNYYVKRAAVALIGLGANQPEDAIYPLQLTDADGAPTTGAHDYRLHFAADELPPADAFWSVTMYDEEGYQIANELDRFAIGDRDALTFNGDGSLDLLIQHERPADVANWLPAPSGPFSLCLRLYAPRRSALDGTWNPPPLRKV